MHKFFTSILKDGYAYIRGEDVKHGWKVLRLKPSDRVEINDLKGSDYLGEIEGIDKEEIKVRILEKIEGNNESTVEITLYQGIPKGQKMELICQKAAELGAIKVVPLITKRVIPGTKGDYKKLDRLERIILEASKQAKRSIIMKIEEPMEIEDLERRMTEEDLIIVPYENEFNEEGFGIKNIEGRILDSKKIGIVIGPEGGFEEDEISSLKRIGCSIVTLGPRILRTETAGLSVISIIQYIRGDLGGKIKGSH